LRSLTALSAAAALLGLGACSPDPGEDPEETAPAPTTNSDDDGAQETRPETEEGTASQDEETSSAAGERTGSCCGSTWAWTRPAARAPPPSPATTSPRCSPSRSAAR